MSPWQSWAGSLAQNWPLAENWALALLHFLWQGAAIAAALAAVLKLAAIRTPHVRYAVCLAALGAMALCPPLTLAVLAVRSSDVLGDVASRTSPVANEAAKPAQALVDGTLGGAEFAGAGVPLGEAAKPQAGQGGLDLAGVSVEEVRALEPWILAGWTVGVSLMCVRLLLSWISTIIVARSRKPLAQSLAVSRLPQTLTRLCAALGVRRVPGVFVSRLVSDATAVGFWRPLVLLPAAWVTELSPDMLEAVLAHELAHIRRGDLWWNLFQRVVETVLFYHPAVWWLSRRLRAERECCCDELAIAATHQRLVYASTLEFVARHRTGAVRPLMAVTLGDSDMALLNRIRRILGSNPSAPSGGWLSIGMLTLAIPVLAWLLAGTPAPQLQADDEKDQVKEVAQGERREGGGERKEGDRRPDGERREGERRDGDRPRAEGERRDGDRPRPEGERRDGDRPRPEGERREGDRPRPDGERREGPRPPDGGPRDRGPEGRGLPGEQQELFRLVQELRREVEQLRQEVRELRGQRPMGPMGPMGRFGSGGGGIGSGAARPVGPPPAARDGERRDGPPPAARDGGNRKPDRPAARDGEQRDGERRKEQPRAARAGERPDEPRRPDGDKPAAPRGR